MVFLSPIPMIVAGALALPALLVFYLLKLRRRPVRVSTTMFWEQAAKDLEVNVPLRWLRPSLLLLLHILILAGLVLALGRPAFGEGGEAAGRMVLIVDASASMNAEDAGGRTRLDLAKERAAELAKRASRDGRVQTTVIVSAAGAAIVGPPSDDPRELARQIASIQPTDQPGDLASALRLAESLAASGVDEQLRAAPASLVLFSDGGDARGRALAVAGLDPRYEFVGPDPSAFAGNTGITALGVRRDETDPDLVRVFVSLLNAGPEVIPLPLTLAVDGSPVQRTVVNMPGARDGVPGRGGHTFELASPASSLVSVSIGREDALPSDNLASAVLPRREPARVLLIAPAGDDGRARPDPFLLAVLDAIAGPRLRLATPTDYERFTGRLGAIDAVVFDRVRPDRSPPRPSLHVGALPPEIPPREQAEGSTVAVWWDREHPTLRDAPLDTLVVSRALGLPPSEAVPAAAGTARTLATGSGGPLLMELDDRGTRRLVVGFALTDSNWPVDVGFPIFIASVLERLAPVGAGAAGRWFSTDAPAFIAAPLAGTAMLDGPVRVERSVPAGSAGSVEIAPLPRAGVYRVRGVDGPEALLPVNLLSEQESDTHPEPMVSIAGRSLAGSQGAAAAAGPREIWWWFLLAAVALLCVEYAVFTARARV